MMIALARTGKKRPFRHTVIRGVLVILAGALLQLLAFHLIPFIDMDVLYLIGLSLPVAYLYLGLPVRKRWIIILAILLVTPLLYAVFGYSEPVISAGLQFTGQPVPGIPLPGAGDIVKSWLIDGWFPVFPWLAIALFGAETGAYRWKDKAVRRFRFGTEGMYGMGLLIAGGALWALAPGAQAVRDGYVELFYPPVTGLLVFCAGVFLLVLTALDSSRVQSPLLDPLRAAGECSLAIYLVHYAIIARCIAPLAIRLPLPEYFGAYLALLAGMILFAYTLRFIRRSWRNQPFLVKFLIGG